MSTPKITVYGYENAADYEDPDWPIAGECSRCGEHHFRGARAAWVLPAEGGSENDLVVQDVRISAEPYVNVGILHVYDKWLDADEARAMARALLEAADLISRARASQS